MKRSALRLVIGYSMCGFALTCAVTYLCWGTIDLSSDRYHLHPSEPWASASMDVPFPKVAWERRHGTAWWLVLRSQSDATEARAIEPIVPRWTGLWPRDWGEAEGGAEARMVAAYGWPLLAFSAPREPRIRDLDRRGPVPLHPVWHGLLLDALAYGAAVALVHQSSLAERRYRRRRRTQCPTCAYDLTGISGPCPECGRAQHHQ